MPEVRGLSVIHSLDHSRLPHKDGGKIQNSPAEKTTGELFGINTVLFYQIMYTPGAYFK